MSVTHLCRLRSELAAVQQRNKQLEQAGQAGTPVRNLEVALEQQMAGLEVAVGAEGQENRWVPVWLAFWLL